MQRVPKGQYFRDSWDWLNYDAVFAHAQVTVTTPNTFGLILLNNGSQGEYLDFVWVYCTVDNPAIFRLTADPAPITTGLMQNPQESYLSVDQGAIPGQIFPYNTPGQGALTIHQTAGPLSEFSFPRLHLGKFVRIPTNWGVGIRITAPAVNTLLQVTWYAQFIGETDTHAGAPALASRRR